MNRSSGDLGGATVAALMCGARSVSLTLVTAARAQPRVSVHLSPEGGLPDRATLTTHLGMRSRSSVHVVVQVVVHESIDRRRFCWRARVTRGMRVTRGTRVSAVRCCDDGGWRRRSLLRRSIDRPTGRHVDASDSVQCRSGSRCVCTLGLASWSAKCIAGFHFATCEQRSRVLLLDLDQQRKSELISQVLAFDELASRSGAGAERGRARLRFRAHRSTSS